MYAESDPIPEGGKRSIGLRKSLSPQYSVQEVRRALPNTAPLYPACRFDGVGHGFIVDLPAEPEGSPLILMLPGYGHTAESFRLETGLERDAASLGYTVVSVAGTAAEHVWADRPETCRVGLLQITGRRTRSFPSTATAARASPKRPPSKT